MAESKEVYSRRACYDDDENTIEMNCDKLGPDSCFAPPKQFDIGLDLSFAAAGAKALNTGELSERIQEVSILVIFDLPDGSQGEGYFKLGQTVEFLKSFVESEYGIPMDKQCLFIEGQPMMDPLSLLDFPEAKGVEEIYIQVDGPLPRGYRK